ncbi:MAG: ABC transporter ATP-binding protein [Alphaproteobacteria bacterium]|nr:ABC transporter ATP-binding protein [Alphaproteobacteria bacterium]
MTAALVEVRDLGVAFATERGDVHALRHVSLDLARGAIVGLVGESGSGKSTLALALPMLLPANARVTGGEIRFDGVSFAAMGERGFKELRGRRIAMVFQDPMTSLNPVISIASHLGDVIARRHPDLGRRERKRRAIAMLDRVGIPDAERRLGGFAHEFSGGMRQRIMIAMALLAEPDLLIADEPTTALDVTIERQILVLLRDLRREFAGTILFISHSLGTVAELCDEVIVLYAGTVAETGASAALFARAGHPYMQALIRCETEVPGTDRRLRSIPGDVPDLIDPPGGCAFAPRCPVAVAACRSAVPLLRPLAGGTHAACHVAR